MAEVQVVQPIPFSLIPAFPATTEEYRQYQYDSSALHPYAADANSPDLASTPTFNHPSADRVNNVSNGSRSYNNIQDALDENRGGSDAPNGNERLTIKDRLRSFRRKYSSSNLSPKQNNDLEADGERGGPTPGGNLQRKKSGFFGTLGLRLKRSKSSLLNKRSAEFGTTTASTLPPTESGSVYPSSPNSSASPPTSKREQIYTALSQWGTAKDPSTTNGESGDPSKAGYLLRLIMKNNDESRELKKKQVEQGNLYGKVKRWFITKDTPKDQLPKTWDEYSKAYSKGHIDIQDPPLPPGADVDNPLPPIGTEPAAEQANPGEPSPYDTKFYAAPRPVNERIRQTTVNRLDLFGAYDKKKRPLPPSTSEPAQSPEATTSQAVVNAPETAVQTPAVQTTEVANGQNAGQELDDDIPDTLEGYPAFKKIVAEARAIFGTKISMLTVLDDDKQIFLAETGLGGMREVPRDVTFCSHTVLNGGKGFVLLDTHKDWRFQEAPLVKNYGSRFYAGVPLLAPNYTGIQGADPYPIGTLCVVDDQPRESFSREEQRQLRQMAEYAQKEIELWFNARLQAKLKRMERNFQDWRATKGRYASEVAKVRAKRMGILDTVAEMPTPKLGAEGDADKPALNVVPPSPKLDVSQVLPPPVVEVPEKAEPEPQPSASSAPSSPARPVHQRRPSDASATSVGSGPSITSHNLFKVFSMATRMVGETLELSLVYLLAVDLIAEADPFDKTRRINGDESAGLRLLSSYNMPNPSPTFDAKIHIKALRAPEKGLLYQNPQIEELGDGEKLPQKNKSIVQGGEHGEETEFASAILVPVCEIQPDEAETADRSVGQSEFGKGYVLCAFTDDPKRVFGMEDLVYIRSFAENLDEFVRQEGIM